MSDDGYEAITIICSERLHKISSTVTGIYDDIELLLRSGELSELLVVSGREFSFSSLLAVGSAYEVTISR